jgi:virginiamycin B lyase
MAQPGGGGYGLRGGAGKLLWFINRPGGAFALARLTMSGALQTVPLPPGFSLNPADMAAEPDGTLWFFGQYPIFVNAAGDGRMSSAFGRVTPAGTLTLFPTGVDNLTSDGRLPSLAVGADGYLWFVGYRVTFHFPKSGSGTATPIGGYLARISSTGTVRPVPLPATTDGLFVFDAVAGPDGTVWCVVGGNGAMASRALLAVAPTGGIRTFPLPADGNAPDSLVVGPDGTIWFTEIPYGQEGALIAVGRLTPTGSLTEFRLPRHNPQGEFPSAAGNPSDMVLGADGNIWFTERLYGMIGQITPHGDISEFHMRDSSYAVTLIGQLLAGTDHALWYTVNYYQDAASAPVASVVGRITM